MKTKFINASLIGYNELMQVLVEGNKIAKIAPKILCQADKIIDVNSNVLMSGFVNAHCHNSMTLYRGLGDDITLQEWLNDYMWPAENITAEEDFYYGELLGLFECLANGITCVEENFYYHKPHIRALKDMKIRARFGMTSCRRSGQDMFQIFDESLKLLKNDDLIKPALYIHSVYLDSTEDIESQITYAKKHNLPMSIHLSESLNEVGECMVKYNKTPVEYLEYLGFFDRPSTAYHCVHLDKDDADILERYNVNVVTCPASNAKLANGIASLQTFIAKNINVAIGTDGPASNNRIDMFREMFLCATLQKALFNDPTIFSASQVLKMATENGAKVLGFNTGKIEEGKLADIILVNMKTLDVFPSDNIETNLVYSSSSNDVYLTMVNGEILYQDGKFNLEIDIDMVIEKCIQIRKKIMKGLKNGNK